MILAPGAELGYGLAAFLGALQGVAEFLPISSSGHLSLAEAWLGIDAESAGHSFNIVVHAGTLLAVLLVYRRDLLDLVRGLFDPTEVASIGGNVRAIGCALLVTASLLYFSHRSLPPRDDEQLPPTWKQALAIGCAQLVAVTPGISRAGSTMAAALALGLGRARAARFSFLLSIPAVSAATGKEALELLTSDAPLSFDPGPFALGFVVAFVVGLASLSLLLRLIERVGLVPFVPYLITLATIALILGS
jgi:undecaprenyl-diphosphatase